MKRYIYLYILLAAAIITSFILYASFIDIPARQEVDMLEVNEIVKSVEHNWPDLQNLNGNPFLYRACVIDNNGRLMWATDREVADSLQKAVRQGYAILDIAADGSVVGKALIETNPVDFVRQIRQQFAKLAVASVILLCAVSVLFLVKLHMVIVRPFSRLESFAHKISTGKFDEPLPMDKSNIFGLFTQSFDVMRASLLDARHKQLEAERAKKELIASLSHDIKTPVTAIKE